MKKINLHDLAIRALILVAGSVAALLLSLKGHTEAVPALALGATLGTLVMARFQASGE